MNIDYDKIRNLLERVTSGNAGAIDIEYCHHSKSCTITWKRPRGLIEHESYKSRSDMFLYVRDLLMDTGVGAYRSGHHPRGLPPRGLTAQKNFLEN